MLLYFLFWKVPGSVNLLENFLKKEGKEEESSAGRMMESFEFLRISSNFFEILRNPFEILRKSSKFFEILRNPSEFFEILWYLETQ